jgi:glycosyltransferase involved in cell wall biosynthesis
MDPYFSIIIPSFNQGHFISETINSILNQSFKNIEVLVIDGGSTDQTIEILKKYGDRIKWISEKDRGQTHAINKGIERVRGEIVAYLNSDDYYLVNTLETVAGIFYNRKDVQWVTGDYLIVDEHGKEIHSMVSKYKAVFRKRLSFNSLSVMNTVIQPSTFLRRSFVKELGLFNEELRYTMDYEYWLRAIQRSKPVVIKEKLSVFRIHGMSKGGSQYKKQFDEEMLVAKRFQRNPFLLLLHGLHNSLIKFIYHFIK